MENNIKDKREYLKSLSNGFKMLVKEGAIDSINTGLVQYYAEMGHSTIKSYRRWKKEGFQVKKGEKALLLWGEPKKLKSSKKIDDKEDFDFFPIAYVFSNLQVMTIK